MFKPKFKIWMPERKITMAPKDIITIHEEILNGPTIGQMKQWVYRPFIDMLDKHKNEIYDGDILEITTESGRVERFVVQYGIHRRDMKSELTVDIAGFAFVSIDNFPTIASNYLNGHDLEIIGNIYEHHNLLDEKISEKISKERKEPTISIKAREIIASIQNSEKFAKQEKEKERREKEKNILQSFESAFADYLDLLKDANITYSAHFRTEYEHDGSYIRFIRHHSNHNSLLDMDFIKPTSYRYECSAGVGTMTYGQWEKEEGFILFIYKGLLEGNPLY